MFNTFFNDLKLFTSAVLVNIAAFTPGRSQADLVKRVPSTSKQFKQHWPGLPAWLPPYMPRWWLLARQTAASSLQSSRASVAAQRALVLVNLFQKLYICKFNLVAFFCPPLISAHLSSPSLIQLTGKTKAAEEIVKNKLVRPLQHTASCIVAITKQVSRAKPLRKT